MIGLGRQQFRRVGAAAALFIGVWASSLASEAPLRVATYNVRNYLSMDRLLPDGFRQDYPKPEAEKAIIRAAIVRVAPDILALQELGSEGYLLELKADLAREGLVYTGHAILEAADETRRLGALWRSTVEVEAIGHPDLEFSYFGERVRAWRGMLELKVLSPVGDPFSIYNLHLKSKYTDDPRDPQSEARRVGEAQAARDRILELYPDPQSARFLIMGDLNDSPNSSAVRRFLSRGDLDIAHILDARDSRDMVWTHYWERGGMYSQVDYILYSAGWTAWSAAAGRIEDWPDYYEGSDHRIVWADVPGPASLAAAHSGE